MLQKVNEPFIPCRRSQPLAAIVVGLSVIRNPWNVCNTLSGFQRQYRAKYLQKSSLIRLPVSKVHNVLLTTMNCWESANIF
jgi:hypothetical protein